MDALSVAYDDAMNGIFRRSSETVDARIAAKRLELQALRKHFDEECKERANTALEAWRTQLASCPFDPEARFQLSIYGYGSGPSTNSDQHVVKFGASEDSTWSVDGYQKFSFYNSRPLEYSSNELERLVPDVPVVVSECKTVFQIFGVRYGIKDGVKLNLSIKEEKLISEIKSLAKFLEDSSSLEPEIHTQARSVVQSLDGVQERFQQLKIVRDTLTELFTSMSGGEDGD
jgi:hypothetical protein